MNNVRLIADIGGTNARFALADSEHGFTTEQTFKAADYPHIHDAIDAYISAQGIESLAVIVLAVAGPIIDGAVSFPNSHWSFTHTGLVERYNTTNVIILNDWEAIGYSLSALSTDDLISIGGDWTPKTDGNASYSAVGPGSGLGVGGLKRFNGQLVPLITEGGHVGFAPQTEVQYALGAVLHEMVGGRVSAERLLSGPGIENIYKAVCLLEGVAASKTSAAEITTAALAGGDEECEEAMALFFEVLGQTAGDVALSQGGFDGVFIGGGICQRFPDKLITSGFRKAFENKGRSVTLMQTIPTWLITHPNPGLLGSATVALAK